MRAARVRQSTKAAKAVSDDGRATRDDPLGEAFDAGAFETGNAADLDPLRPPIATRLNGHDNRLLAGATAADPAAAGALPPARPGSFCLCSARLRVA